MATIDPPERLRGLIAAMTLDEKIGQLTMLTAEYAVTGPRLSENYLAEVRSGRAGNLLNLWGAERTRAVQRIAVEETRLGIPLLLGFDVVHGHRTVFPVPLGEAAAFDPELWRETARAAAVEAAADGVNLTFAPMLDVARDPRWGRSVEGPGEDPFLAARLAEAKTAGFQGDGLAAADSVATTAKHLAGYGAVLAGREYASADISDRQLHEVHLPPFRAAVAAGTAAIMPGFHDLAGIPMTAHAGILRDLVRDGWGFDGVMISDYNAITELLAHGVAGDLAEAAALALKAGVDIDMMGDAYHRGLPAALERGLVAIDEVDAAVLRVLRLKARLGLFEDPFRRGATALAADRSRAIHALAREAARRSAVLLTNDGVLPLAPGLKRLALIGPLADSRADMLGPWSGAGERADAVSVRDGLVAALPAVEIACAAGVAVDGGDAAGIAAACALAQAADLTVLCLGEAAAMSGEAASRGRADLPGLQRDLAEAVLALGKPVVAVLFSGRPLMVRWLVERAGAVLAAWHPGSAAGHALADLLTGRASPSGRLPVTWPVELGQVPIFYGRRPSGRPADAAQHYTSKYLDLPVEPLFPFGHGLGYTRFAWSGLQVTPAEFGPGETLRIEARITNAGERPGEELALLFIRDPVAGVARPLLELKGFQRAMLAAGETATVRFELAAGDLAYPGPAPDFAPLLEPGEFEILVGPSADPARLLKATVRLRGR